MGFPDAPFIEPQPCRSLCWANCLAYVLAGYGARMSVASVLYRMGAPERCSARDDAAILMGAAGQWVDDVGRSFLVRVNRLPDLQAASATAEQFEPIVHALSRRPLIVGVPGHSRVLVDMVYVDAPMIWMRQDALTFRDPWTGSPNRVVEAWDAGPERLFALGFEVRKV